MRMLKKTLKSRRGASLALAVMFMVLVFTLGILLSSLMLIGHYGVKIENRQLLERVAVDQIGEDHLAALAAGEDLVEDYGKYDYTVEGNVLTVWRKGDETQTVILYVEAEVQDGTVKVLRWCYSLPEGEE